MTRPTTWAEDEQAREFSRHREAFARKAARDKQKKMAKADYGRKEARE